MATSKGAGAGDGNPANQPGRGCGGNCSCSSGAASGGHGEKRSEQIGNDATLASGLKGLKTAERGVIRRSQRGHGNVPPKDASLCLHDQPKMKGKRYRGGKEVSESLEIPDNIQASERRHGAGNADFAGREKQGQSKAERLNMSVENRF
jgi:hypothetical protein